MAFSDNIKALRMQRGYTQKETASHLGITTRTLQNYEIGAFMPRQEDVIIKMSEFFGVPISSILTTEDYYVMSAAKREGIKAERELRLVLSELSALFSGGKLSDEDKENVMRTMNEIYWDSKEKARKKYTAHGNTHTAKTAEMQNNSGGEMQAKDENTVLNAEKGDPHAHSNNH